jgi:hypothetical protein
MMFGPWGEPDHDECARILHRALDAGINFIDTADAYSDGESEEIVGKAIAGRRDEVVIATKFFAPMGSHPNMQGGSRRWILQVVEHSLRRLGTDYIDLYQIHRPDDVADIDETLGALSDQRAPTPGSHPPSRRRTVAAACEISLTDAWEHLVDDLGGHLGSDGLAEHEPAKHDWPDEGVGDELGIGGSASGESSPASMASRSMSTRPARRSVLNRV